MQSPKKFDVIIIGGGPAGATAAANLAMKGRRVAVLEKERYPHYKVGESMIPYCYFPLQRIGMIDKLKASAYTKKYSVQFAGMSGKVSKPFYFFEHMDHEASQSWQVNRDEFDQMMLDNAREKGAEIFMEMRAKNVIFRGEAVAGVTALDKNGDLQRFEAPMTIDASGRNGFLATRNGWRIHDPVLKKIAIWTYYKGAKRDDGYDEGATTVAYIPEKGWFWYIPLKDDMVSVGVVAGKEYLYRDTRDPETIFLREVENNAWIKSHLSCGERCQPFKVTGDFSYRASYSAMEGAVLAGDAFAFLDPVFSTGLFLAFISGEFAAEAVEQALSKGDFSADNFIEYSRKFCDSIEAMRKLVYVFYDQGFNFKDLLMKYPALSADVTDCLIGNVDRDFQALFEAIAEFAEVPAALEHGRPLLVE